MSEAVPCSSTVTHHWRLAAAPGLRPAADLPSPEDRAQRISRRASKMAPGKYFAAIRNLGMRRSSRLHRQRYSLSLKAPRMRLASGLRGTSGHPASAGSAKATVLGADGDSASANRVSTVLKFSQQSKLATAPPSCSW